LVSNSTGSFATRVSNLEAAFQSAGTGTSTLSLAVISYVDSAVATSTASIASSLQSLQTDFATPGSLAGANYNALTTLVTNSTSSFATRVTNLESSYTNIISSLTNKASINYVDTTVASSTGSFATRIGTIESSVGTLTTTVTNFAGSINGVLGKYGVTVNNNGAISGYVLNSGGSTSSFIVSADQFKIYTGGGTVIPFSVTGATVSMQNVEIASTIKVGSNPARSGTTMSGSGAVINSDGTFALGTGTRNITFNGTAITINGDLISTGNIISNAITNYSTISSSTPDYLIIPGGDPTNVAAATISYLTLSFTAIGTGFVTINWSADALNGIPVYTASGRIIPVEFSLWRGSTQLGTLGVFDTKDFIVDTPGAGTHNYIIKANLGAAPYTDPLNGYPSWDRSVIDPKGPTYDYSSGYFVYFGQSNHLANRPTVTSGIMTVVEYKK
jgi:hypothetical protein